MRFYDRVADILFPYVLMKIFCYLAAKTAISSFAAAVCHSEERSVFRPIFAHEGTRRRAKLQSLKLESGRSATYLRHPLLVCAADHLAHHAAQKHQQEPGNLEDTTDYLEQASHDEFREFTYYDECYHMISFLSTQS